MRLVAVAGILATLAALPCASFQKQDSNLDPRPQSTLVISLEGLLRFLGNFKGNDSSEAMAIKLIEMYGLGFRPTPEDMGKLREASASEDLLKAIESARMPPAKPIVKQGRLTVGCEPVDCDVWLNGNPIGATSHGQTPLITLTEGPVTVSASKTNYDPSESKQVALIRQNELTRVEFQFKISRAGLLEIGAGLFQQMRRSMGASAEQTGLQHGGVLSNLTSARPGDSRPGGSDAANGSSPEQESNGLRAAGTLYLHDSGEHSTAWSVVAWFWEGNESRFELSRLRERYVLTRTKGGDSWNRARKTELARELEAGIRLVVDGQLPRLMERLGDPGLTMIAVDFPFGNENLPVFRAEGGPQVYLVTLDAACRPSEIRVESPGPGAGLRMLYSDYVQQGSAYYPKTTQIILPNGTQGVEARFDTVQIGSSQNSEKTILSKHRNLR
jgi:hypothetical protein